MSYTNDDLKAKFPNADIIEFCYKCHKLYKVPDYFLDIMIPICSPCYKKYFSIQKDEYQCDSQKHVQSSVS
jgi:hypothetical protein